MFFGEFGWHTFMRTGSGLEGEKDPVQHVGFNMSLSIIDLSIALQLLLGDPD